MKLLFASNLKNDTDINSRTIYYFQYPQYDIALYAKVYSVP